MSKRQLIRRPTRRSLRRRLRRRGWIIGCLSLCGIAANAPAQACCLTDWLYGRAPAYAAAPVTPYAAAYAPSAPAYTAGYTPVLTAGAGPAAGIASHSQVLPLSGNGIYSPNAAYSVQRPAYGPAAVPAVPLENPSVYTGQPVALGYRGLATTSNPFYGTGNIYPNNYAAASPTPITAYRPAGSAGYAAARPAAAAAAPQPQFATPVRSGLARFFSSLLGTGYRSSYYSAPVTYYRPATTLDPVSGTTVTVQQPCTSTVQQLQRTPITSFQPAPAAPSYPSTTYPSDCGVASGSSSVTYGDVTTIPTNPSGSVYPGLSGATATSPSWGSGIQQTGDAQPVPAPTLPTTSYSPPSYSTPPSYEQPSYGAPSYDQPSYQPPPSGAGGAVVDDCPPNVSPLTGSPSRSERQPNWDDSRNYGNAAPADRFDPPSSSDRVPLEAPRLESERPRVEYRSEPSRNEQERERTPNRQPAPWQPEQRRSDDSGEESYYQRSREEAERDRDDLRELTTQSGSGSDRSWHSVRPIPAPRDYRNPFDTARQADRSSGSAGDRPRTEAFAETDLRARSEPDQGLEAPDLLPPLPAPSERYPARWNSSAGQASERRPEASLSVPIREASIHGGQDRIPSQRRTGEPENAWQPVTPPERTTVRRQPAPAPRPEPTKTVWYSTK